LALPQPANPTYIAIGSLLGALLIILGFSAASRCRSISQHSAGQRTKLAALAVLGGIGIGSVLVAILVALAHREPALRARFAGRLAEPAWRPWFLGLESSIVEEVVFRLFVMGVVAWLASRFMRNPRGPFFIALVASAVLFGLAHLPAWLAAAHATPGLVGTVLFLNGSSGLMFAWLFWRWGLPYAIVCHFMADIIVQSLGPRFVA
jgi:phosphotransferase system  glucose/maltose/N-acetylglucosamine-specific IIC component